MFLLNVDRIEGNCASVAGIKICGNRVNINPKRVIVKPWKKLVPTHKAYGAVGPWGGYEWYDVPEEEVDEYTVYIDGKETTYRPHFKSVHNIPQDVDGVEIENLVAFLIALGIDAEETVEESGTFDVAPTGPPCWRPKTTITKVSVGEALLWERTAWHTPSGMQSSYRYGKLPEQVAEI